MHRLDGLLSPPDASNTLGWQCPAVDELSGSVDATRRYRNLHLRKWRNWQTHQLEGLAVAIPSGFESPLPHHQKRVPVFRAFFIRGALTAIHRLKSQDVHTCRRWTQPATLAPSDVRAVPAPPAT